jgi:PAS domain S-box-containing protein
MQLDKALLRPRILIVDDDNALSQLLKKALHREGWATVSADSFESAVDWLEKNRPDLMLLDLKLRGIGGQELVDHLSAQGRSVPFIIITGQGDERVAVAMMKRGAMDYLVKDGDFLQFLPAVVRRALWQLERDRKLAIAEEALRRSEANLAKAQQIAHLGSYELNVPSSDNDYRSEEIFRILGLGPGQREFSRTDYVDRIVHPADREHYCDVVDQSIRMAKPFSMEYRVVRPDGSIRTVQSVGEPVLDEGGKVIKLVGTLLDITERKRADLRQQIQYATTRALGESATLAEAAPQILKAVCQTLGWQHGELWGVDARSSALSCVETWRSPADEPSAFERMARQMKFARGVGLPGRVWAGGEPLWMAEVTKDPEFTRADCARKEGLRGGLAFPVLLKSEVLGVLAFFSCEAHAPDEELLQLFSAIGSQIGQFIERKRAEEGLRREHALNSAILDTSAALVVVLERHGRIVRFNRACEQITGWSAAEIKGKTFWNILLFPEEFASVKAVFDKLNSGRSPQRHENYLRTRNGDRRLISWSNSALTEEDGTVEYIISIGIDVSERRRLEQEILHISELEQRRIGQDLHDGLCQHLAATELMSEILAQKLLKQSEANATRAFEITRHVRDAIGQTRLLARGLSPVVLESEGLMSALQELAANTEKMFRIICEFTCAAPVLFDDHTVATHLYRIAQEAVSNAIRHGKARRVRISLGPVGDRTVLSIRDDGTGLGKEPAKHKGMGLRIMQYRAGMIGGTLSVQDEPGGGAMVSCSIVMKSFGKDGNTNDNAKGTETNQNEGAHR